MRLQKKRTLTLLLVSLFLFAACAAGASGQEEYDQALVKERIQKYFSTLFPQLQNVELTEFEEEEGSPLLKGTVTFQLRGREQTQPIYLTRDGKRLLLGQVWDLTVDPDQFRWEEKKKGAEERMEQLDLSDRPYRGNPDAKVVVVEFSDYQCPYCSRAYSTLEKQLVEAYPEQIKLVFKHLPLESLHPWAKKASIAAACTYVQNPEKFWGMHSRLFENQKEITVENLQEKVESFAAELELDETAFQECFANEETKGVVEADLSEATQMGISSTPTFLINGAMISGAVPFEEISGYIDMALKDAENQ